MDRIDLAYIGISARISEGESEKKQGGQPHGFSQHNVPVHQLPVKVADDRGFT